MDRALTEIAPARGDRVAIIGQTGTGKTTLVHVLLQARSYVVVLDTKGSDTIAKWPGYKLFRDLKKLQEVDPVEFPKVIYRPSYEDQENQVLIDEFFDWVYRRRHCTVYVDELATPMVAASKKYGACLMRGREFGIEVWSGTQRPTWIPMVTLSESEHCYCFRLRLPQDQQRVEATAGIPARMIEGLKKREFIYSRQDGGVIGPQTLVLRSGKKSAIGSESRSAQPV